MDIFLDWLKFFRKHAVAGKVLLIIDGHASHVKSTEILKYCISNDIILLCLPAHTTKYLQPLDRSVYKSLKSNFQTVTNLFKRRNPELSITKYRFGSLFTAAWGQTATTANAISGFRACGIYPYNPDAIPDEAYAPAETTEREVPDYLQEPEQMEIDSDNETTEAALPTSTKSTASPPPTAGARVAVALPTSPEDQPSTSGVSFRQLQPLPKVNHPQKSNNRHKQKSGELTTDEYVNEVRESEQKRQTLKTKSKSKPDSSKGKEVKKAKVFKPQKLAQEAPTNAEKDPHNFCHYCGGYYFDADQDEVDWIEC